MSFILHHSAVAASPICFTHILYCFITQVFLLLSFASTLIAEKIIQFIHSFLSTHPPLPLYFVFLASVVKPYSLICVIVTIHVRTPLSQLAKLPYMFEPRFSSNRDHQFRPVDVHTDVRTSAFNFCGMKAWDLSITMSTKVWIKSYDT